MRLRSAHSILVVLLALVMSIGQVCACTNHTPSQSAHDTPAHVAHAGSSDHQSADHHHENASPHQSADNRHEMPCEDDNDCAHCQQSAFLTSGSDIDQANLSPVPSYEKLAIIADVLPAYQPGFPPEALSGLAWLDPPPQTPVSLKVRLLN